MSAVRLSCVRAAPIGDPIFSALRSSYRVLGGEGTLIQSRRRTGLRYTEVRSFDKLITKSYLRFAVYCGMVRSVFAHIAGIPFEESALAFAPLFCMAGGFAVLRLRRFTPRCLQALATRSAHRAEGELR